MGQENALDGSISKYPPRLWVKMGSRKRQKSAKMGFFKFLTKLFFSPPHGVNTKNVAREKWDTKMPSMGRFRNTHIDFGSKWGRENVKKAKIWVFQVFDQVIFISTP